MIKFVVVPRSFPDLYSDIFFFFNCDVCHSFALRNWLDWCHCETACENTVDGKDDLDASSYSGFSMWVGLDLRMYLEEKFDKEECSSLK